MESVHVRKTRFTEFFIRENGFHKTGFSGWVFYSGMLFQAREKWWGNKSARSIPHEGLDFCWYRDSHGALVNLPGTTRIPLMYDGVVVKIMDDFLGKSIVAEHRQVNLKEPLFTVYGHMVPAQDLPVGRVIREGHVIGALSDSRKSNDSVSPHLHVSLFLASTTPSYEALDWNNIHTLGLEMLDPLDVLDGEYLLV